MRNQTNSFELILAAEEFSPSEFKASHRFSSADQSIIQRLVAHGPVLLRGGRGSGKSALMIEAASRLAPQNPASSTLGIYLSLRYLPLLRSSGAEYEALFFKVLVEKIVELFPDVVNADCRDNPDIQQVKEILVNLAEKEGKRIVLLFDDAAHIGRETSLQEFFDIFRTLSSPSVSCKATIYPGVTRFGTRFDIYNDATTIDLFRNEGINDYDQFFNSILTVRFPNLFDRIKYSSELDGVKVAGFLARAVLGNMRAFVSAGSRLIDASDNETIDFNTLTIILKNLSENYYWPLLEELRPKLGIYEVMLDPAHDIANILFKKAGEQRDAASVLILRDLVSKLAKPLELLEYSGFISRRETSKAMKSGGRGARYQLSICNLLERVKGARLTVELFTTWNSRDIIDPVEFHRGSDLANLSIPLPDEGADLEILSMSIDTLMVSDRYPYGLTEAKLQLLHAHDVVSIGQLAEMSDDQLMLIPSVGVVTKDRIKSVVGQAIWM